MIPVHELLNRIRWDKEFGQGRFEIGFFDRYEDVTHRVAFHRIREVYRDGERIGHRPNAGRREIERIC